MTAVYVNDGWLITVKAHNCPDFTGLLCEATGANLAGGWVNLEHSPSL